MHITPFQTTIHHKMFHSQSENAYQKQVQKRVFSCFLTTKSPVFSRIVGARTVTRYDSTCVWLCHCRCQYGTLLLVLLSISVSVTISVTVLSLFWCLCFSFKELETQQQFYSCSLKHVYVICVVIVMFVELSNSNYYKVGGCFFFVTQDKKDYVVIVWLFPYY